MLSFPILFTTPNVRHIFQQRNTRWAYSKLSDNLAYVAFSGVRDADMRSVLHGRKLLKLGAPVGQLPLKTALTRTATETFHTQNRALAWAIHRL